MLTMQDRNYIRDILTNLFEQNYYLSRHFFGVQFPNNEFVELYFYEEDENGYRKTLAKNIKTFIKHKCRQDNQFQSMGLVFWIYYMDNNQIVERYTFIC